MYITISTYYSKTNSSYLNNCIKSERDYTKEEWDALLRGEEVESEWDEEGNPTAYDFIAEEEIAV